MLTPRRAPTSAGHRFVSDQALYPVPAGITRQADTKKRFLQERCQHPCASSMECDKKCHGLPDQAVRIRRTGPVGCIPRAAERRPAQAICNKVTDARRSGVTNTGTPKKWGTNSSPAPPPSGESFSAHRTFSPFWASCQRRPPVARPRRQQKPNPCLYFRIGYRPSCQMARIKERVQPHYFHGSSADFALLGLDPLSRLESRSREWPLAPFPGRAACQLMPDLEEVLSGPPTNPGPPVRADVLGGTRGVLTLATHCSPLTTLW
jgi:hypothetical protein